MCKRKHSYEKNKNFIERKIVSNEVIAYPNFGFYSNKRLIEICAKKKI